MNLFLEMAKFCVLGFFGTVIVWNLIDLLQIKARRSMSSELYFEKQMWIIVALLAIAITLGNL